MLKWSTVITTIVSNDDTYRVVGYDDSEEAVEFWIAQTANQATVAKDLFPYISIESTEGGFAKEYDTQEEAKLVCERHAAGLVSA